MNNQKEKHKLLGDFSNNVRPNFAASKDLNIKKKNTSCEESEKKIPAKFGVDHQNGSYSPSFANHDLYKKDLRDKSTTSSEVKHCASSGGSPSKLEEIDPKPDATCNEIQIVLIETLKKVRRKGDTFGIFSEPVDPVKDDCADYFSVVNRDDAMDLSTMEALIKDGSIRDIDTFQAHFKRIIDCALLYNQGNDNFVRVQVATLEKSAKPLIDISRRRIVRLCEEKKKVSVLKNNPDLVKLGSNNNPNFAANTREVSSLPYVYTHRDFDIPGARVRSSRRDMAGSEIVKCDEWLSKVGDMMQVCNEAARRRTLHVNKNASHYDKPLSESYILERLELDDPVQGFIVQTVPEKKMQGFIIFTNFTVWRKSFRWDSLSPNAGITPLDKISHICDDGGSLSKELESLQREGDPEDRGIICHRIAEICLLGALGCGNILVRNALEQISKSQKYDYVVLQATKMAIPFYERMGFVHVGAVGRFKDDPAMPEVPYRHWSDVVGGETVEASYMMVKRVTSENTSDTVVSFSRAVSSTGGSKKKLTRKQMNEVKDFCRNSARSILRLTVGLDTTLTGGSITFDELVSISIDLLNCIDDAPNTKNLGKILSKKKNTESNVEIVEKVLLNLSNNGKVDSPRVEEDKTEVKSQKKTEVLVKDEMKVFRVFLILNDTLFDSSDVNLSTNTNKKQTKAIKKNQAYETGISPLSAAIDLRSIQIHKKKQSVKALRNIHKMISNITKKKKKYDIISCGDRIMIEKGFHWEEVVIDRKCRSSEIPFGGNSENSYVLLFKDKRVEARIIDSYNGDRGIGRKWCTLSDWVLFSLLPIKVIDALVNGGKVTYTNEDGRRLEGTVIGRLREDLKWTIRFDSEDVDDLILNASELRPLIRISNKVFHRVRECLETYYPKKELSLDSIKNESITSKKESEEILTVNKKQKIRDGIPVKNACNKFTKSDERMGLAAGVPDTSTQNGIKTDNPPSEIETNKRRLPCTGSSGAYSQCSSSYASHKQKRQQMLPRMRCSVEASSTFEKKSYRGVYFTSAGKWDVKLDYESKLFHLGTFSTQEEAWKFYYDTFLYLNGHVRRGLL